MHGNLPTQNSMTLFGLMWWKCVYINIVIKYHIMTIWLILFTYIKKTDQHVYKRDFPKCHTPNEIVYYWFKEPFCLNWGQYAIVRTCVYWSRGARYIYEYASTNAFWWLLKSAHRIFSMICWQHTQHTQNEMRYTCKATQSGLPRCIANRYSNHLIRKTRVW